ncbi:hypothetical protein RB195_013749 [Necator americanus]|uniref:Uncharacterized protein n=1 Tax=Necator americanus TaxID=51031 RepID=A0ABR1DX49_NECAM
MRRPIRKIYLQGYDLPARQFSHLPGRSIASTVSRTPIKQSIARHLPRLMFSHLLCPILGDELYCSRLIEIDGKPATLQPKDMRRAQNRRYFPKALTDHFGVTALELQKSMPLYCHVHSTIFPRFGWIIGRPKSEQDVADLYANIPPPQHFLAMVEALGMSDSLAKYLHEDEIEDIALFLLGKICFDVARFRRCLNLGMLNIVVGFFYIVFFFFIQHCGHHYYLTCVCTDWHQLGGKSKRSILDARLTYTSAGLLGAMTYRVPANTVLRVIIIASAVLATDVKLDSRQISVHCCPHEKAECCEDVIEKRLPLNCSMNFEDLLSASNCIQKEIYGAKSIEFARIEDVECCRVFSNEAKDPAEICLSTCIRVLRSPSLRSIDKLRTMKTCRPNNKDYSVPHARKGSISN